METRVQHAGGASAKPGRPRFGSDPEKRRRLIGAAEAVFLEKGFHAATMDDIARRAGMSKKTVYQVITGKTALFDMLLADRLSPLFVPIEDDGRPLDEILVEFLENMARIVLSPQQIALTRLMVAESPRVPELGQALQRQGVGRGNGALENWLAQQAARGRLAIADPQEAGDMLFGMTLAELLLSQLVGMRPMPSEAKITARIREAVAIFLAGAGKSR